MAKLTLLVAAPPLALAMLVLLSSFQASCAAAEAEQPGAEESDLDTGVAGVDGPGLNASAASFGHSGVARATWYGAPNGAGPYDNGTPPFSLRSTCWVLHCFSSALVADGSNVGLCRRRLRFQEREQVPVHGHDLLRQPAAVQGRQGMRRMLQGTLHSCL
jgi:hypothetical protein